MTAPYRIPEKRSPHAALVASQPARIVTALSSAASEQRRCQVWRLLLVVPEAGRSLANRRALASQQA